MFQLSDAMLCRHSSDSAFHHCLSVSAQILPDVGSATCLDLQAHDVHQTRKMKDDSKIHHIVDDLVSRPRKMVPMCRLYPGLVDELVA